MEVCADPRRGGLACVASRGNYLSRRARVAQTSGITDMRVVRTGDSDPLEFRVTSHVRGEMGRPPIVLVHGIGMSHRYFARLHKLLAQDHSVYSIDLPGFGGLRKPRRDASIEAMAEGLADVIASLVAGPVVLVGHSMGAQWVVETALQREELVSHAVIVGPVTDDRHRTLPAQLRALALDTLRETPSINAIVFTDYLRCGVSWYLTQVRRMLRYPIEERVPRLRVPLLIIRGERDPIAGLEWCRRLRRAGNAVLVAVPGHAHVVQQSAPKAVAAPLQALSPTGTGGL